MTYTLETKNEDGTVRVLTATEEQTAIIDRALTTKDSLMLNALAGAAKTSTLQFLCKYLPVQPILCLAFNKRIAEEMAARLPGHVKCQTLNSLGHGVWAKVSARKLVLDSKKSYRLLTAATAKLNRREKELAYDSFAGTLRLITRAKINGYIPDGIMSHAKRLITTDQFWENANEDCDDEFDRFLVDEILTEAIKESYAGTIDFDDQIYMSALFGGAFPQFPLVMVDEAQDLSPLNLEMLRKLFTGRLIAVGDPWQSIYGFRGAVSNGMRAIADEFSMTQMTLSVSFRCPKAVVRRAQQRVPHFRYADWAAEGEVIEMPKWAATDIPDGAAIICRNNAPLLKLAFSLIMHSRGIELRGFDIGPSLVKALRKLGPPTMTKSEAYLAIDKWEEEKLARKKGESATRDRAECLRVFVDCGGSLAGAITHAETIFRERGPIQLLSGHKSKGLEWDNVFHLDPWRIPSPYAKSEESITQELNVKYVIETRAKRNLFLVTAESFDAA